MTDCVASLRHPSSGLGYGGKPIRGMDMGAVRRARPKNVQVQLQVAVGHVVDEAFFAQLIEGFL